MKIVLKGLMAATLLGGLGGMAQAQDMTTTTSPQTAPVPSDPMAPTDPLEPLDPSTPGELPSTDPLDPSGPPATPPASTSPMETTPAPMPAPDASMPPAADEGATSQDTIDDGVTDPATPEASQPPR